MRFSQSGAVLALLTLSAAAPTLDGREAWSGNSNSNSNSNSNNNLRSLLDFVKRVPSIAGDAASSCNLDGASIPAAPLPLPALSAGLTPYHVAIGRGTQNYTCDLSNTTAIPVARGALATLFNVSCVACDTPALSNSLSDIAINLPDPSTQARVQQSVVLSRDISGHHYFIDDTTAYFNLHTALHDYGQGAFKKTAATPAPKDAMAGQYGQGDGAVAWLKLEAKDPSGVLKEVYRVNTAGGNPPKSCTGMPAAFEVQYSAEYWFFT